jgi:hypothetical protein
VSQGAVARAHSGPPYPILSNRVIGAYDVSIWTDPDATDDGSAQGKFWVVLAPASKTGSIPADTTVQVTIRATDRTAAALSGKAAPADGLITRQFVALPMDHEGPFSVHVAIDGPLGHAGVDSATDATYDVRPAPLLLLVFLFPFVAVGALWFKAMRRRRRQADRGR